MIAVTDTKARVEHLAPAHVVRIRPRGNAGGCFVELSTGSVVEVLVPDADDLALQVDAALKPAAAKKGGANG